MKIRMSIGIARIEIIVIAVLKNSGLIKLKIESTADNKPESASTIINEIIDRKTTNPFLLDLSQLPM